jgi:hypothetical protein
MTTLELKKEHRIKGQEAIMTGEIDVLNGYFLTEDGSFELEFFQEVGYVEPKKIKIKKEKQQKERKEREVFEYRFYFNDCTGNYVSANSTSIKDAKMQIGLFFSWRHDWDGSYTKYNIETGEMVHKHSIY